MKLFVLNMGSPDRVIRFIVGVALVALVFVGPRSPWGWLGIILILTGLFGMCPLYSILGISTKPRATA